MHKLVFSAVVSVGLSVLAVASPSVTGVTWTQDADTRLVTVNYTLAGAPAVVTFDFLTNGVSIGGANLTGGNVPKPQPTGDVFRLVAADGAHSFTWQPDRTWSDHVATGVINVKAWATDNPPDYMAVSLEPTAPVRTTFYPGVEWLPGGVLSNPVYRISSVLMRRIHAGGVTWMMGDHEAVGTAALDDIPYPAQMKMHAVTLPQDYYIGVFEFTQGQGKILGGINSSVGLVMYKERWMRPCENDFGYHAIREATNGAPTGASAKAIPEHQYPNPPSPDGVLGKLRTLSGLAFDMPGEAQWEFAARGGHGDGYWPNGNEMALYNPSNHTFNAGKTTERTIALNTKDDGVGARYRFDCATPGNPGASYSTAGVTNGTNVVGSYPPNGFGLYDVLGNVGEWCLDWYQDDITGLNGAVNANLGNLLDGRAANPVGRVVRGGNYMSYAFHLRPSYRQGSYANGTILSTTTYGNPYSRGGQNGLRLCCPVDVSGAR